MSQEEKNMFTLRLPLDLYQKVKERASESNLSMTQFIIATLKDAINAPATEKRLDDMEKRLTGLETAKVQMPSSGEIVEGFSRMDPEAARKTLAVLSKWMEYDAVCREAYKRLIEPTLSESDKEEEQQ